MHIFFLLNYLRHVPKKFRTAAWIFFSNVANPRFLYINRKIHSSTLQIGPYQISKWRGVRDMSVERGPCKIMLKTDFGQFFAKLLIFPNFQYTIGKVLKNDGEKMNIPSDCPDTAVFRLKKGYFQRLISRRRRLTLTRDPHQWKIWTF
jgi:hypothetical protein